MCSLRDAGEDFENYGVKVYGLSLDDVQSQAAFHKAQELNFALLSDTLQRILGFIVQIEPFHGHLDL